jgi:hypothetical protein
MMTSYYQLDPHGILSQIAFQEHAFPSKHNKIAQVMCHNPVSYYEEVAWLKLYQERVRIVHPSIRSEKQKSFPIIHMSSAWATSKRHITFKS